MDALLDIVRSMRLTGGLFLEAEFAAPWCVSSKVGPEDCAPFTPQPKHIIAYHYITAGRCLVAVGKQQPVPIEAGHLIVLPRNDDHILASSPDLRPISADELIQPAPEGGLAKIVHGGTGERTQILCGFLGNELPHNAILALLPNLLTIEVSEGASASWIESNFRFAATQLAEGRPSSPVILAKLAELLFLEAVRRFFMAEPTLESVLMAGMRDPVLGRALGLIHSEITRRWTTEELAREIALSRSAFAERFSRAMGEPPMRYIARQRLQRAAARLSESNETIARIAYAVGYESEVAFNRAFRREYGTPPAAWRREFLAQRSAVLDGNS